jgi:ABC-2 type transport system ATP-binding protein
VSLTRPAPDPAAGASGAPRHNLLTELVAYLSHRQDATGLTVADHVRTTRVRAERTEARHAAVVDRLATIDGYLTALDAQVAELRALTVQLRGPELVPNGLAAVSERNGHEPALAVRGAEVSSGKALLRVEHLAKEIGGNDILRDISFEIFEGEILGLIGPNGAGKTTLMECLAGLRPRSGGTFYIGDEAPPAWQPKDQLFYLPNNVLPYSELYTREVLAFFGRLYEVPAARWSQIVLRDLSLGPVLDKRVGALSKGNMQRLLIALALMSPQSLLALDEPFDGLDLHQTQAMMGILRGLRAQGRTLLLCIHQLNDAERICDRFLLLSAGRLVGVGTLTELRVQTGLLEGSLEEIFLALT